jgi:translocator protein
MSTRKAPVYAAAATVVAATAAASSTAVNTGTAWYRTLRKPPWQPPSWTFGAVWTPLYATIAWSAGHAVLHTRGAARRELLTAYGINLAANAAWSYLFFGRRSTLGGLAGTLALDASNADLVRRANRRAGAAALCRVVCVRDRAERVDRG